MANCMESIAKLLGVVHGEMMNLAIIVSEGAVNIAYMMMTEIAKLLLMIGQHQIKHALGL